MSPYTTPRAASASVLMGLRPGFGSCELDTDAGFFILWDKAQQMLISLRVVQLGHEPVTHCGLGQKVFRLGWVIFELAPQVTHVHTNVVLMRDIRRSPHLA